MAAGVPGYSLPTARSRLVPFNTAVSIRLLECSRERLQRRFRQESAVPLEPATQRASFEHPVRGTRKTRSRLCAGMRIEPAKPRDT